MISARGVATRKPRFTGVRVNAKVARLPRRMRPSLLIAMLAFAGCGGAGARVEPPATAVTEYVGAVRAGDAEAAYALLDEQTRAEVPFDEFRALMRHNRAELADQAEELEQLAAQGVRARARVPLETGETVALVLEEGRWVIDGGVLDAPALRTPRDAILSLRRALRRRSLRGMERVLARQPRAEIEAEIERLLEETADEQDLRIEVQGNRARVVTTSGREITLVREAGEWRVLTID